MNQTRRVTLFCGVLVFLFLSPWIVSGLFISALTAYGKFDVWRYRPMAGFSDVRWKKPDLKYRFSMLQEVVEHQIRPGMTANEVKSHLGEPDSLPRDGWQYEARRPGWQLIDWQGGGLLITFSDQNTVESVEKNHWVD